MNGYFISIVTYMVRLTFASDITVLMKDKVAVLYPASKWKTIGFRALMEIRVFRNLSTQRSIQMNALVTNSLF